MQAVGFVADFGAGRTAQREAQRRRTCERSPGRNAVALRALIGGGNDVELSDIEWGTPRGEGSYGSVFFGTHHEGDKIVVKCPKNVPLAKNLIETEKYVNRKLSAMDGRWPEYLGDFKIPYDVNIPDDLMRECLIWKMEGDGSTLEDFLMRKPRALLSSIVGVYEDSSSKLKRSTCKAVMRELLIGVAEMQDKGIMHRDIKPANIIVSPGSTYPFRIIDFGSACDWKTPLKRGLSTATCDPVYAAPERRLSLLAPDKFDVFALGLIAMQILLPSMNETWKIADFKYRLELCDYDVVRWCAGLIEDGNSSDMIEEVRELYDDEVLLPVITQMLRKGPMQRASVYGVLASGAFGAVAFGEE